MQVRSLSAAFRRNFLCPETPIEWRRARDESNIQLTAISKIADAIGVSYVRTGGDREERVARIGGAVEIFHPIERRWQPLQAVYARDGTTVKLVLVHMRTGLVILSADAEICEELRIGIQAHDVADVGQKIANFRAAGKALPSLPTRHFHVSSSTNAHRRRVSEGTSSAEDATTTMSGSLFHSEQSNVHALEAGVQTGLADRPYVFRKACVGQLEAAACFLFCERAGRNVYVDVHEGDIGVKYFNITARSKLKDEAAHALVDVCYVPPAPKEGSSATSFQYALSFGDHASPGLFHAGVGNILVASRYEPTTRSLDFADLAEVVEEEQGDEGSELALPAAAQSKSKSFPGQSAALDTYDLRQLHPTDDKIPLLAKHRIDALKCDQAVDQAWLETRMPRLYPHDGKIATLIRVSQRDLRIKLYEEHMKKMEKLAFWEDRGEVRKTPVAGK